MTWGSKWPTGVSWFDKPKLEPVNKQTIRDQVESAPWPVKSPEDWLTHTSDVANSPQSGITPEMLSIRETFIGWDRGTDDKTTIVKMQKNLNSGIIHVKSMAELKSQGSNLVDEQAYLYFQCEGCGEILDPHTKSFRTLQEYRVKAGWACKWNIDGMGYKVYCAECGEKAK